MSESADVMVTSGLRFTFYGLGFRKKIGFRVSGLRFTFYGLGFRKKIGFRVQGLGRNLGVSSLKTKLRQL